MNPGASSRQRSRRIRRLRKAAEPGGDLGEHADRGDVGGVALEVLAQQGLGHGDPVLAERGCRSEQLRVARRSPDVIRVGGIGTRCVAHRSQVVAEATPRIGEFWLQLQRAAQRGHRVLAAPGRRERERQFVVRGRPLRVRARSATRW